MHYLKRMQEPDTHNDLLRDLGSIILAQYLLLLHKFKEILAVDQFCDDVDVRLGLDALFELQQKGVRHYLHYAALVAELGGILRDEVLCLGV